MQIFDKYKDEMELKILTASIDDSTNLLNHINTSLVAFDEGKLKLELGLKNKEVFLEGGFIYNLEKDEYTEDEIDYMTEEFMSMLDSFNEKKIYKATLEITNDKKIAHYKLIVLPNSPRAKSIKKIEIRGVVSLGEKPSVTFVFSGLFNSQEMLVKKAQEGLTGMFYSLVKKEMPSDNDMDKILEVIEAVLESMDEDQN